MGARPLARVIQEHIKKPLAEEVLFGKLVKGGTVRVLLDRAEDSEGKLTFQYISREEEVALPKPPERRALPGKAMRPDKPKSAPKGKSAKTPS
jgi:ATP-dependent Clp protease ATP-binding subunit ClpA